MVALELTQAAAEKGLKLLAKSEMPNGALRVAVRDGGCSGMRYELLFDETKGAEDDELEFYGLKVWVDPESAKYLDEMTNGHDLLSARIQGPEPQGHRNLRLRRELRALGTTRARPVRRLPRSFGPELWVMSPGFRKEAPSCA